MKVAKTTIFVFYWVENIMGKGEMLRVLLSSTSHSIFSKPLAGFLQTIFKTMDSNERGMNSVTVTIINSQKEYWPSRGLNQ